MLKYPMRFMLATYNSLNRAQYPFIQINKFHQNLQLYFWNRLINMFTNVLNLHFYRFTQKNKNEVK